MHELDARHNNAALSQRLLQALSARALRRVAHMNKQRQGPATRTGRAFDCGRSRCGDTLSQLLCGGSA